MTERNIDIQREGSRERKEDKETGSRCGAKTRKRERRTGGKVLKRDQGKKEEERERKTECYRVKRGFVLKACVHCIHVCIYVYMHVCAVHEEKRVRVWSYESN